jgi:hypothetical protein
MEIQGALGSEVRIEQVRLRLPAMEMEIEGVKSMCFKSRDVGLAPHNSHVSSRYR